MLWQVKKDSKKWGKTSECPQHFARKYQWPANTLFTSCTIHNMAHLVHFVCSIARLRNASMTANFSGNF